VNSEIHTLVSDMLERLSHERLIDAGVIGWASPVISFGNFSTSPIATLGLNPSNKEFVDNNGNELEKMNRRFPTLRSLGIHSWTQIEQQHIEIILDANKNYFSRNPYDTWFKSLDNIISGTTYSYYKPLFEACHLDLVPYTTFQKWGELSGKDREFLLSECESFIGRLLQASEISLLVLNGKSVVNSLASISNVNFSTARQKSWTLGRKSGEDIKGYSYTGIISKVGSVNLDREIKVLGFNHNIQSSFGVTRKVRSSIQNWVLDQTLEFSV